MQETIAAVILAGGHGRRLGGVDKALLPLAGKPLLAHVLARLRPQTTRMIISANGDADRFREFSLSVIADAAPDQGPLAGIAAGARACTARWPDVTHILTVPVDTPLLPLDLAARLAEQAAILPAQAAVAHADGRMHWTVALWPVDSAVAMHERVLHGGMRRLQDGLETVGWHAVSFTDAAAFTNINNLENYKSISRLLIDN